VSRPILDIFKKLLFPVFSIFAIIPRHEIGIELANKKYDDSDKSIAAEQDGIRERFGKN